MKYSSWGNLAPREAGTQPGPPGHCGQALVSSSLVSKPVFFSRTYHRPKRASLPGLLDFLVLGGFVVCFCLGGGLFFWFGELVFLNN